MSKSIEALGELLKISFNDPELLKQAVTHRSYLNEHRELEAGHNERLEFLGDAVLELVVTDYLFRNFADKNEGDMTSYRAALVNTNTLAESAHTLGLNEFLLLSKGEAKDTGRARNIILADTFEAVIGAIYLDQGYEVAERFIAENLFPKTGDIIANNLWQDSKSYFQEKAQDEFGTTPTYQVLTEDGPDHNKRFTVGLYIGDELIAQGMGHSKQEAEQEAARMGLNVKGWATI